MANTFCKSWYFDPPSSHQLKKNVVKVGPPLTKLSGSAHVLYVFLNLLDSFMPQILVLLIGIYVPQSLSNEI